MSHNTNLASAIKKTLEQNKKPDLSVSDWQIVVESLMGSTHKGKWIDWTDDRKDYCKCSVCDYGEEGEVPYGEEMPYCPWCGAEMF